MNKPIQAGRLVRTLIYVFPAFMDVVAGTVFFVCTVRAARMGASAVAVGGIITAWSTVYLLACPVVGRFVTRGNAARMMTFACASAAVLCGLLTVFPGLPAMYVLVPLLGVSCSLFFPPFQVFMKAVDVTGGKSIAYSAGMYTFAWSTGYAVGPFVAGFLMELGRPEAPGLEPGGWRYALLCAAACSVLTLIGVRYLGHLADSAGGGSSVSAPANGGVVQSPSVDYSGMPNLAWLGWIGAGVGVLAISVLRGVFPTHAVNVLRLADSTQGLIFFLLSMAQGLAGLAFCRSRLWMYRPGPVAAFGIIGAAGTLLFAGRYHNSVFYAAALLFGVYSGSFFFYLVFHSLTHPSRSSQYVAINESVVGVFGIVGPLAGGALMDRSGFVSPCIWSAALVAAVTVFQAIVHWRNPPVIGDQ